MRRKYATTLGDPLGEMVYALEAEFYWLQYKWQEYVVLFGSEPSRIEVLNRAAPAFFVSLRPSHGTVELISERISVGCG
jgi:hypothetical protein